MTILIDAHQHFWQRAQPFDYRWLDAPALAPIRRDYLPEHLEPHLRAAGLTHSIVVQTQHRLDENRWALALAERHPFLAGVVGWVDLASPACEEQVVEMRRHPKFVGVRHVVQDEPDDDFIVRPDVLRGLRVLEKHGVPFDLLFYVKHLRHAAALARQFPSLPMVIDHLAKPHIKEGRTDDWLPQFRAAAAFPNVCCKLSGVVTEADWRGWSVRDLKPYVQTALELFGPERCLFGSDWPVCELAATYEQVHAALVEALGPLSESERTAIFGGAARRFYRLPLVEDDGLKMTR
jgi:L-fuconolactonase